MRCRDREPAGAAKTLRGKRAGFEPFALTAAGFVRFEPRAAWSFPLRRCEAESGVRRDHGAR